MTTESETTCDGDQDIARLKAENAYLRDRLDTERSKTPNPEHIRVSYGYDYGPRSDDRLSINVMFYKDAIEAAANPVDMINHTLESARMEFLAAFKIDADFARFETVEVRPRQSPTLSEIENLLREDVRPEGLFKS